MVRHCGVHEMLTVIRLDVKGRPLDSGRLLLIFLSLIGLAGPSDLPGRLPGMSCSFSGRNLPRDSRDHLATESSKSLRLFCLTEDVAYGYVVSAEVQAGQVKVAVPSQGARVKVLKLFLVEAAHSKWVKVSELLSTESADRIGIEVSEVLLRGSPTWSTKLASGGDDDDTMGVMSIRSE